MRPEFFSQFSLTNEEPICLGLLCEIVQAYWTVMGQHYIKNIQVYGYPEYDWIVDTLQELAVIGITDGVAYKQLSQDLVPGPLERIGQFVASLKQRHSIGFREANWVLADELQDILRE
jgi:hypothetical protein